MLPVPTLLQIGFALLAIWAIVEVFRQQWGRAQCERRSRRSDAMRRARERDSNIADEAMAELEEIQEEREQAKHASVAWRTFLFLMMVGLAGVIIWSFANVT